ncbi:MAG: Tm-1-like ATP-binding domain-containing protein [Pseudomonadota bacterium]
MQGKVLLLATLATKQQETDYLMSRLHDHGVDVAVLDVSLHTRGKVLNGPEKQAAMQDAIARVWDQAAAAVDIGANAIVGIGGGTGGEIILSVLRALPITFPKVLVTTLPFDPRAALADNSIVLVPTLVDICGLNATLREVLENTAALTAGLCSTRRKGDACVENPSVGITALGATEGAIALLVQGLRSRGQEATVFHANGYGGAAFSRFATRGAFHSLIDLTPHELTRITIAGAHVPMPDRFTAAADRPRIVLPGGLNFIGLGAAVTLSQRFLSRPHYAHSASFTHVKLTPDEMEQVARALAGHLNALTAPCDVIIPMGGFSHQDRPGGAIEDAALRAVFRDTLMSAIGPGVHITEMPDHISGPAVTDAILATFDRQQKEAPHG